MKTKLSTKLLSIILAVVMVLSSMPLTALAKSNDSEAYLFAYFTGNGSAVDSTDHNQAIRFAVSTDGYNFEYLNDNNPVIKQEKGTLNCRDAYIFKGADDYYYIINTDMDASKGWGGDDYVSKTFVYWRSKDLLNWQDETIISVQNIVDRLYPNKDNNVLKAWAPQVYFDEKVGEYYVYFALECDSVVGGNTFMYGMYTPDLLDESKYHDLKLLIKGQNNNLSIDGDIWFDENTGTYYLYFKDETKKTICYATSSSLSEGYTFQDCLFNGENIPGLEGCNAFRKDGKLVMFADAYADGYFVCAESDDYKNFTLLDNSKYAIDHTQPRHGSVIPITMEQYNALVNKWGKTSYTKLYDANAELGSHIVGEYFNQSSVTKDTSGNNNTLTNNGVSWWYAKDHTGEYGSNGENCVYFSAGSSATVNNLFANSNINKNDGFSISFSAYNFQDYDRETSRFFDLTTTTNDIVWNGEIWTTDPTDYLFLTTSTMVGVRKQYQGDVTKTTSGRAYTKQWHDYLVSVKGDYVFTYVDGVLVSQLSYQDGFDDAWYNRMKSANLRLGKSSWNGDQNFDGLIKNVRAFDIAITPNDINNYIAYNDYKNNNDEYNNSKWVSVASSDFSNSQYNFATENGSNNNSISIKNVTNVNVADKTMEWSGVNWNANRWQNTYGTQLQDGAIWLTGYDGGKTSPFANLKEFKLEIEFDVNYQNTFDGEKYGLIRLHTESENECGKTANNYSNGVGLKNSTFIGRTFDGSVFVDGKNTGSSLSLSKSEENKKLSYKYVVECANSHLTAYIIDNNGNKHIDYDADGNFDGTTIKGILLGDDDTDMYCHDITWKKVVISKPATDDDTSFDNERNAIDKIGFNTYSFNGKAYHVNDECTGGYSNVIYQAKDSTNWVACGAGRVNMNLASPSNIVLAYDGVNTAKLPVVLEVWNNNENDTRYIHFVDINSNNDLIETDGDFKGYSKNDNDGNCYLYWPVNHSSYTKTSLSADQNVKSAFNNGNTNEGPRKFWNNSIKYVGSGNKEVYYDKITNYSVYSCTGYGGASRNYKYNTSQINSNIYVINYKAVTDIMPKVEAQYNSLKGNENKYSKESVYKFYNAVYKLVKLNPNNYAYSANVEDSVKKCASEIEDLVNILNDYKFETIDESSQPVLLNYVFANGTLKTVSAKAGDITSVSPQNTIVSNSDNATHIAYKWDTNYTSESITINEIVDKDNTACDFETSDSYDVFGAVNGTTYVCKQCKQRYVEVAENDWSYFNSVYQNALNNISNTQKYSSVSIERYRTALNNVIKKIVINCKGYAQSTIDDKTNAIKDVERFLKLASDTTSAYQLVYHESFDDVEIDGTSFTSPNGNGTFAASGTGSVVALAGNVDRGPNASSMRENVLKIAGQDVATAPGNYLMLNENPLWAVRDTALTDGVTISFWRQMSTKNGSPTNVEYESWDATRYDWKNAVAFQERGNNSNFYIMEVNGVQSRCAVSGEEYVDLQPYYNDNTLHGTSNIDGNWVNFTYTYDPVTKGVTEFVNGVERDYQRTAGKGAKFTSDDSDVANEILDFITSSTTDFYLNNGVRYEGNQFDMYYDDIRIYTGCMTELDIVNTFNDDISDTPTTTSITHDPTNVTVYTLKAGTYTSANGSGETYVASEGKTVGEEFINYYDVDVANDVSNIEYYSFGTGMVIEKSADGVNWTKIGDHKGNFAYHNEDLFGGVYTEQLAEPLNYTKSGTDPNTSGAGYLVWAPHIMYNLSLNKWVYYGSTSFWGGQQSAIFYCTSDDVEKNYQYQAIVYQSRNNEYGNGIDADVYYAYDKSTGIIDKDKLYLAYGSWGWMSKCEGYAIWGRELDSKTGGKKANNDTYYQSNVDYKLAGSIGNAGEGAYVIYRGGYYYLYVAYGNNDASYTEAYLRSENPNGPFETYNDSKDAMFFMSSYDLEGEKYVYWSNGHSSAYNVYNANNEQITLNVTHSRALSRGGQTVVDPGMLLTAQGTLDYYRVNGEIQYNSAGEPIFNIGRMAGNIAITNLLSFTESGWNVMLPLQYNGTDTTVGKFTAKDIAGTYKGNNLLAEVTNATSQTESFTITACDEDNVFINGTKFALTYGKDYANQDITYISSNDIEGVIAKQGDVFEFAFFNKSTLQHTWGYQAEKADSETVAHSYVVNNRVDANGDNNGYSDCICSRCNASERMYDDQSWEAYDSAVAEYMLTVENTNYTSTSVDEYKTAVTDVISTVNKADQTKSQSFINSKTTEILEAKSLLVLNPYQLVVKYVKNGREVESEETVSYYKANDLVNVKVPESIQGSVYKWTYETENGTYKFSSNSNEVEYVVSTDTMIVAYLNDKINADECYKVSVVGRNGRIMDVQYVNKSSKINEDMLNIPQIPFYSVVGYLVNGEETQTISNLTITSTTIIEPIYSPN